MADIEMNGNGDNTAIQAALSSLGDLEKDFAEVELKYLRQKEHDLKPLFVKREAALRQIPDFWPTVFLNGPEELQQLYSPNDMAVLSAMKSFSIERYQIKSHVEGEPRSLRLTFEFEENDFFDDTRLVKEFEYVPRPEGPGDLVSKPVPIKWKGKKKDLTEGLLDAAVELYQAEQAMTLNTNGKEIDMVAREGLWQYEKLREKLQKQEESAEEPSIMNFFGFRGAVARQDQEAAEKQKHSNGKAEGTGRKDDGDDDDDLENEEDDDDDDGMLEVEIFPAGEEVAISLAEDLWPDALDYFMQANEEPAPDFGGFDEDDEELEVDSDGAPDLVGEEELAELTNLRPAKRQRTD